MPPCLPSFPRRRLQNSLIHVVPPSHGSPLLLSRGVPFCFPVVSLFSRLAPAALPGLTFHSCFGPSRLWFRCLFVRHAPAVATVFGTSVFLTFHFSRFTRSLIRHVFPLWFPCFCSFWSFPTFNSLPINSHALGSTIDILHPVCPGVLTPLGLCPARFWYFRGGLLRCPGLRMRIYRNYWSSRTTCGIIMFPPLMVAIARVGILLLRPYSYCFCFLGLPGHLVSCSSRRE